MQQQLTPYQLKMELEQAEPARQLGQRPRRIDQLKNTCQQCTSQVQNTRTPTQLK